MKKAATLVIFTLLQACGSTGPNETNNLSNTLQGAKLFANLPNSCPTPDAFAIAPDNSLTLSCPNYASKQIKGMLLSLSASGEVTEIGQIKTPQGFAQPMGMAYDEAGNLFVANNAGPNKGTLLKLRIVNNNIQSTDVIAKGMTSPNGLRYKDGYLYLTQVRLPKAKTQVMSSGLYRFKTTDRNLKVNSNLSSANLIFSTQTNNPNRQFGLDGLVFDSTGNLFVGDFGDAQVYKLTFDNSGKLIDKALFATLDNSVGIDGLAIDSKDNIYVAGFLRNQIFKITPDAVVSKLAEYPDNNGENGEIDQPADLIVYDNKLIISNFDLMKGQGITNLGHSKPYTISYIPLQSNTSSQNEDSEY